MIPTYFVVSVLLCLSICRFCATRLVEDRSVAERAFEVWGPCVQVIKHYQSSSKSKRPKNNSYETLVEHHTDLLIPAKLQFFVFVATIFEPYLSIFQTDTPMIPFMFSELEKIYTKLLRLVFRRNCLEETSSITKRLKRDWLEKKENHLEDGLVDIGAAAKLKLQESKVKAEAKRKFRRECKQFIINVLIKISKRSPTQFSIVRNSISLDPISMVRHPEESSQRFTKLADRVVSHALQDKKIYEIEIDQQLRKSCQLSYPKYKAELERLANEDKKTERDMKPKLKLDEIETVKRQKLNIQSSIDALEERIFTETLAADENQDLTLTAKAVSFCRTMKEKQKTLKDFEDIISKLEQEYKAM